MTCKARKAGGYLLRRRGNAARVDRAKVVVFDGAVDVFFQARRIRKIPSWADRLTAVTGERLVPPVSTCDSLGVDLTFLPCN